MRCHLEKAETINEQPKQRTTKRNSRRRIKRIPTERHEHIVTRGGLGLLDLRRVCRLRASVDEKELGRRARRSPSRRCALEFWQPVGR
eukprot:3060769-Pyramimonas_sp.AAC.1